MTSPWSNQRISLLILDASVTGFSGLFVYSPFPGTGNLIGSWAAAAGVDPYGNAYPAGLSVSGGAAVISGPDYVLNSAGLFVYSAAPAFGNLIASIAPATGTDAKGNAFLAGVTSYAASVAVQMLNGQLEFYNGSAGGPWTIEESLGLNASNVIQASINFQVNGLLNVIAGATITGGLTVDTELVTSGQAGGLVLEVKNTTAAPTAPNLRVDSAAAGDPAIGLRIIGDTANRLLLDDNGVSGGRIRAGTGAAALDTAIYRAAAAQWAADPVAFNNSGAAEVWQTVGGTGAAFANGWANAGAPGTPLQYKHVAAPDHAVSWVGRVLAPAGIVAGQAITAAVPAGYRPNHTQKVAAIDVTTGAAVRLSIGSTGVLTYQSGAAAGDSIDLGDLVYLDA